MITCSMPECSNSLYLKGLCQPHYGRLKRYGDPLKGAPVKPETPRIPCSLDCGRLSAAKGLCKEHHRRFKRYGDPKKVSPLRTAPINVKICTKCGEEKPLSAFVLRKGAFDHLGNPFYLPKCRKCNSLRITAQKFRISEDTYLSMLSEAEGKCELCGEVPVSKGRLLYAGLVIDHSHVTGKIRGLLCPNCNSGLGMFGDDLAKLKMAVAYLEIHMAAPTTHYSRVDEESLAGFD